MRQSSAMRVLLILEAVSLSTTQHHVIHWQIAATFSVPASCAGFHLIKVFHMLLVLLCRARCKHSLQQLEGACTFNQSTVFAHVERPWHAGG